MISGEDLVAWMEIWMDGLLGGWITFQSGQVDVWVNGW